MNADELQKARTRNDYLQAHYRDRAAGFHPECEPICVSEAAEMLPVLLTHIDLQAWQIAALKAALIDRDVRLLEPCNGECGKNDIKPEDCDQCEHDYARSQLAQEMPDIFGEATK